MYDEREAKEATAAHLSEELIGLSVAGDFQLFHTMLLAGHRVRKECSRGRATIALSACGLTTSLQLLLSRFPSRRILSRHATRNAAALAVNDGRNRTVQPGLIFGIEFRQLCFAGVSNVLFHVFWSVLLLKLSVFHTDGLTDQPAVFLLRQPIKMRARFMTDTE